MRGVGLGVWHTGKRGETYREDFGEET